MSAARLVELPLAGGSSVWIDPEIVVCVETAPEVLDKHQYRTPACYVYAGLTRNFGTRYYVALAVVSTLDLLR